MDRKIRTSKDDWSEVPNPKPAVEAWEKTTGIKLPADYRSFILNFNGGQVFPLMFDHKIPLDIHPSSDSTTFLDPFYDWAFVEDVWNGGTFSHRNPPNMLVVGANPGGIEVLLSVDQQSYGRVFTWLHSQSAWGEAENNAVWPQANSFRAFVDSLYEDQDGTGNDYWDMPGLRHLERLLEF